ncbi:MAG: hypothetical protein HKN87_15475 [Saprospiraceae bacterium]|nr:hypothetical protein [Saprospiraceae bacterium]
MRNGLLAQQVEQHFPQFVTEGAQVGEDQRETFAMKSVNYQELIPLLIHAVQELNDKVEAQLVTINIQ